MISIANLLDAAKAKAGIESDYRLAKVIGITHSVVSSYRVGKSMPNDKILAQLCALSGDDVAVVAAEIQAGEFGCANDPLMDGPPPRGPDGFPPRPDVPWHVRTVHARRYR